MRRDEGGKEDRRDAGRSGERQKAFVSYLSKPFFFAQTYVESITLDYSGLKTSLSACNNKIPKWTLVS